ncbi:MAG: 16S rRNA (cytidine(1402)-2'-O)-methyltransferase [Crocinitomicaceae bacterium]|nr:16S rRNA (cytidine(1402)-2'-O)-methyltransferase [Crocinitomicaceae bacterium]|tara:strand:+ start:14077 stop:14751 length:675 start_codon:yes stop_codon:yes gene_type:complete
MSCLYIVPTPIGNLKDITIRSIELLNQVDLILAEDTRTTSHLLKQYNISTPLRSYHQYNEHKITKSIVKEMLEANKSFALVSDAGTPAISDPGFLLIREGLKQGLEIITLPGPTAFVPALLQSGFPCDTFIFEGFLPHKKGRQKKIIEFSQEKRTIVLYESPHRIEKLLKELEQHLEKDRKISISRELTKKFEETTTGTIHELQLKYNSKKPKGEFVVVIEGKK